MFVLGIINIVCGGIIVFTHVGKVFEYVTHSMENLLILLIGSLFICTGFILLGISRIVKSIERKDTNKDDPSVRISLNESNALLKNIRDSISALEINRKREERSSTVEGSRKIESTAKNEKKPDDDTKFDNCEVVHRNGRVFAFVDGDLYCRKCHVFIDSDTKSMCPNCGASLME